MENREMIKEELTELLANYYNGSFVQMVCDYIHLTGMTKQEVENMLKPVRDKKGRDAPFHLFTIQSAFRHVPPDIHWHG